MEKRILKESKDEEGNDVITIESTGNYGNIFLDSKTFDDKDFFEDNIFNFKISKIKIFHGKIDKNDIVTGIQIYYRNRIEGTIITTGEFKSEKNSDLYEEIVLDSNENLINFQIRIGEKGVNNLAFATNKRKIINCGGIEGEKKITEFDNNFHDKIILGFFGSYSNCLNSFGVYFIYKKDYIKIIYGSFFELKYLLKQKKEFKNQVLENKGKLNLEYYIILKVCLLPDSAFCSVMKYILC